MITLAIRYTIDHNKFADFEAYVRALPSHIERCGGKCVGYYLPTRLAGPSNAALGLIDFPNLAAYERYREALAHYGKKGQRLSDLQTAILRFIDEAKS